MTPVADVVDDTNGTYVNRVTVVYRAVEFPNQPPTATVVMVADGGVAVDRDELRQRIERLHYSRDSDGNLNHQPYTLSESYHHTSWGADGAALEFVVQAAVYAVSGIVGGAAWDGLKAIGRRISQADHSPEHAERITEAVAVRRATDMIEADLDGVGRADLKMLSVHLNGDTATVVFRASDGSTITVQPSLFDGGAIGPITRSYSDGDATEGLG